ncbi:hypothetical protein [Paraburkholderia sp. C35]|uniref:hypothetical protein n=1 Tax=Paraburkholderia sp. C35 TaxID=2126993 RepID=UPI0013A54ABF|nr:hypothetical protein [Paraburkholderia sp. C35]
MSERLHVVEWQERTARIVFEGKPVEREAPNNQRYEQATQIRQMIDRGLSTKAISASLGVSTQRVRQFRLRMKREQQYSE